MVTLSWRIRAEGLWTPLPLCLSPDTHLHAISNLMAVLLGKMELNTCVCRGLSKHMACSSEAVLPVFCFSSKLQRGLGRVGAENKNVLVILVTASFLRIHYKPGIILVLLKFISFDHQSFECFFSFIFYS